jgi:hypothetical protein
MKFKTHLALWILIVLLAVFIPSPAHASSSGIILVMIPGLSLDDLDDFPNLSKLAASGGIGLMNTGAANKRLSSAYLSISAGRRAACPAGDILAFQAIESYEKQTGHDLYRRYTGNSLDSRREQIVYPFIHRIRAVNSPEIVPGLLGEKLSASGIPVILLGNHDLPHKPSRPGALIAMNKEGLAEEGIIDERASIRSSFSPAYYTTNYDLVYSATAAFLLKAKGLAIIDLGDLVRLDSFWDEISREHYLTVRRKLVADLDDFLGKILEISSSNNCSLLVISPFPAYPQFMEGLSLTPALFKSPDTDTGLLTSPSTKREGIIANLDIAPTITSLLGLRDEGGFGGKPINVVPDPKPLKRVRELDAIFSANYLQRPYFLKSYVVLQIIAVLGFIALLFLKHPFLRYFRTMLLALQTCPLLFLLLPLFPSLGFFPRLAALLLSLLLLTVFLELALSPVARLALLFGSTVLLLSLDILRGAPLMKISLLGYDPISGARYYGIGNEYLGVLLGASLIGLTLFPEILRRTEIKDQISPLAVPSFFLAITYLVAAPQWGTNVGGGISFFSCFILLLLIMNGKRISIKALCTTSLLTMAALGILFYYDLSRPEEVQSHIGVTADLIREEGIHYIWPVIKRKLQMNWKLFHYSLWSRVLVTFLASLALLFYRPIGLLRRLFQDLPYLRAGLITGIIGTFVILLANDSGIVAAATTMIYVAPTLLYLLPLNTLRK